MKYVGEKARAFCRRPRDGCRGVLLHGPDAALVALCRRDLVAALTEGDALRLTRFEAGEATREPAALDAALRARSFFAGRNVVLVEEAGDALARPLTPILAETTADDAFLLVTARTLARRSALRRLFEEAPDLAALALYPDPAGGEELGRLLASVGLAGRLEPEAEQALRAFAAVSDPATLLNELEKLALHALDSAMPLDADTLARLLPAATGDGLDELVGAVAEGDPARVSPLMRRLTATGVTPVAMLIATARHFRQLLLVATSPRGAEQALARLRPPVFGPRRRALAAQARRWRAADLEAAQRLLFDTDRRLRSPGQRPDRAMVERTFIRLAMLARRRQ